MHARQRKVIFLFLIMTKNVGHANNYIGQEISQKTQKTLYPCMLYIYILAWVPVFFGLQVQSAFMCFQFVYITVSVLLKC